MFALGSIIIVMTEHDRGADPDDEENGSQRPSGAGETIIIGGKEYWDSPETGGVIEVPDTDTSDDSYNPEHDDYVESE